MSDIFEEVDEEVRRERLLALWKNFGPAAVGVFIVIIAGWSGWVYWQSRTEAALGKESHAYEAAAELVETDRQAALEAFGALNDEASPGYAAMAGFREAALLQEDEKWEEAVAIYDGIAADDESDSVIRGLAQLLAAEVLVDHGDENEVRQRLDALITEEGHWAYSARELIALLDFRAGNLDAAESTFNDLSFDVAAPGAMKARAQEMLELVDSARLSQQDAADGAGNNQVGEQ